MSDNRNGHSNRNTFDAGPNSRVDLLLESPRVQQILLHQKLKEEIEKNSTGRIRYVDSELYMRTYNDRSPIPEAMDAQSATSNVGADNPTTTKQKSFNTSSTKGDRDRTNLNLVTSVRLDEADPQQDQPVINRNCNVCLIKEVRQDLMNINRMVQDRNEHISRLKAKCLRSYFERQMMD